MAGLGIPQWIMNSSQSVDHHANLPFFSDLMDRLNNKRYFTDEGAMEDVGSSGNDQVFRTYRFVVDVIIVSLLCFIGFAGNILTIVILRSDRDKNSTTNWLLQSLAVVDIVYLIACVFIQPVKAIHDISSMSGVVDVAWASFHRAFVHVEPYIWTMASIAETITVWTVLFVTIDRYIAICMPMRSKIRTMRRARAAVLAVAIIAVVYNIPVFFERRVIDVNVGYGSSAIEGLSPNVAIVKAKVDVTELRRNTWYFVVYKTICYFVFRKIGPLLVLIGLNARLMNALREMRRRHRCLTQRNRQRENVTLTLVVVVTVFIVCELPDVCLRVVVTVKELMPNIGEPLDEHVLQFGVLPTTNALLTLNSAGNFFIYCLMGHKFRHIMLRMIQSRCDARNIVPGQVIAIQEGSCRRAASCGCCYGRPHQADVRQVQTGADDEDDAASNGFATAPQSMTTRASIALTTINATGRLMTTAQYEEEKTKVNKKIPKVHTDCWTCTTSKNQYCTHPRHSYSNQRPTDAEQSNKFSSMIIYIVLKTMRCNST